MLHDDLLSLLGSWEQVAYSLAEIPKTPQEHEITGTSLEASMESSKHLALIPMKSVRIMQ